MVRHLAEPRNILEESLGSAEPRLKNTGLNNTTVQKINLQFSKAIQQSKIIAASLKLSENKFANV